jgi:hypothetical protein
MGKKAPGTGQESGSVDVEATDDAAAGSDVEAVTELPV